MKLPWRDHLTFFGQFRQQFETTGAVAPSSRFLASAMTGPLRKISTPRRILEVGPGTGAVTKTIIRHLNPEDQFDLVEINQTFADVLKERFATNGAWESASTNSRVHVCPLQEFQSEAPYDIIISGLPLNNFPPALVEEIFASFFKLLAPNGVLSYFEYMYVRAFRKRIAKREIRERLNALDQTIQPYLSEHRFGRSWVFVNFPPAWVQHLRKSDASG